MPQVFEQTAPVDIKPDTTTVQANEVAKSEESLISRASKVSLDTPKKDDGVLTESIKLDQATIDKITDPVLKASVQEAYKSMQSDYTRKTQELATKRKEMDQLKSQLEQSGQYTPSKIQQLLADPSFVQAAQDYQRLNGSQSNSQALANGDLTAEEISYLSPEQQKLYHKTKEVEQTNQQILSKLSSSETARVFEQQDITLKSKYANYDSKAVDQIYDGMMRGTIQATREHLWKVQDYDHAVQRAYQLGKEDRKMEMSEKVAASSQTNGVSVVASSDVPVRLPNESGTEYFKRIALSNAAKFLSKSK